MRFLSALSDLWDVAVSVGKDFLGVVRDGVRNLVDGAKKFVDAASDEISKLFRGDPKTEKERIERQLQEVNKRAQSLRKRYKERGYLTDGENDQWHKLKSERKELNEQLRSLEQYETAGELVAKEKDYTAIHITNETAHVLQFHVGQNTHNKICTCGRPMVLQWDRRIVTPNLNDFFWGCSGWYIEVRDGRACERMVRLTMDDLDLFANLKRAEFDISSDALTKIALDPVRSTRLRAVLQGIKDVHRSRRMGVSVYRCPVHGESLVVRQKRTPNGLLDEFFLGCPRWLPENAGCNFIVKLKSPAQISGVLEAETGSGLIRTVN